MLMPCAGNQRLGCTNWKSNLPVFATHLQVSGHMASVLANSAAEKKIKMAAQRKRNRDNQKAKKNVRQDALKIKKECTAASKNLNSAGVQKYQGHPGGSSAADKVKAEVAAAVETASQALLSTAKGMPQQKGNPQAAAQATKLALEQAETVSWLQPSSASWAVADVKCVHEYASFHHAA